VADRSGRIPGEAERSAAEREAARLERERRRAGRVGGDGSTGPPPRDPRAADGPVETDGAREPEDDFFTDEHEIEVASGTRRVSRREGMTARQAPARPPRGRAAGGVRGRPPRPRPTAARGRASGEAGGGHTWLGRIMSVVALLVAAIIIWFAIEVFQPFGTSPHGSVTVVVPAHASSSQIGDLLARDGVISSSFFFEVRATLDGDRSAMRAGAYHLQKGMSFSAVLTKLTTAPPAAKVTELTVAEGRRRAQISTLLHAQGIQGNYLAQTRSTKLLNLHAYGLSHPPKTLEGFLFPDTYQLLDPIKISALVKDQLETFKQQFATVNFNYARGKHLTPYDVLKVASLIEAETPNAHDRPLVASVIYNRLADGMYLGLDSTDSYATGHYTNSLTVTDLHSKSPFNTFTHLGLPPTPIDNPGMATIQAAAHPANTHYLYFFSTSCRRNSVFATSYAQFLAQGRYYAGKHC
jgi:UPF0755 protein